MTTTLTGHTELLARLKRLERGGGRIARTMVSAGLSVLEGAMKDEAPGRVREEIGSSVERGEGPIVRGKVGVGVGKAFRTGGVAHQVILGTQERFRTQIGGRFRFVKYPTRRQLSTGRMPANPFVRRAVAKSLSIAQRAMQARGAKALRREITRG